MRVTLGVLFVLAARVALCADLHAAFYLTNAPQGSIQAVLEGPQRPGEPLAATNTARLMEDGRPGNFGAAYQPFRSSPFGVTAILAIDASGTMKGSPIESIKTALRDYISASRPQDRIAIISFADSVVVNQAFTADKEQLTRAIDALAPGGRQTLLNSAIDTSLKMLAKETSNIRRHVLVITDGKNEGPGPSPAELGATAASLAIPVDCIGVTRVALRYLNPMKDLAAASGGAFVTARGFGDLSRAMKQGIEALLSAPLFTWRFANLHNDGAKHTLAISVAGHLSNTASVVLPPPPADVFLLVASLAAISLVGAGAALVVRSRRMASRAEIPVVREPVAAPQAPVRPRTATVYERGESPPATPPMPPPMPPRRPTILEELPQALGSAHSKTAPDEAIAPAAPTVFRRTFPAPAAGRPGAWLRVIGSPAAGGPVRYPIEAGEVLIGSSERSQIRLTGDTTVSRAHATIHWSDGDLFLSDNNSTNGTTINEQTAQPGHRVALNPGDRIRIGDFVLLLEAAESR